MESILRGMARHLFFPITELGRMKDKVTHVFYKSPDGHSSNTTLETVMDDEAVIAHTWNDELLSV